MGIDVPISYSSGTSLDSSGTPTESSSKSIGIAPRLGANLALTELLSIWLRGSLGYSNVNQSVSSASGTNQHMSSRLWVAVSAPLLVHPTSHFFIGAGPFV